MTVEWIDDIDLLTSFDGGYRDNRTGDGTVLSRVGRRVVSSTVRGTVPRAAGQSRVSWIHYYKQINS